MFKQITRLITAGSLMIAATLAQAQTLNFVYIDGLAEQAIGSELLKEVYKRADMQITVTAMPGQRALAAASSGEKDRALARRFQKKPVPGRTLVT